MTKGEDTRSTVLDAALAMASREGLAGVTIGRLAEQVGMSKSGLFAHFASRDNLEVAILQAGIDRFIARVVSPALKAPRGEPRLRALFDRWIAWGDDLPGGCIFRVAAVELDDRPGPARDLLVASQRDLVDTFSTIAKVAIEEGHLSKGLDPQQLAFEIYCLGYGYHQVARLLRDPAGPARLRAALDRLLHADRA